jgi:hypothetical protein
MNIVKRGKGRFNSDYSIPKLYKFYLDDIGGKKILKSNILHERNLYQEKNIYTNLIKEYLSMLMGRILDSDTVELPHNLGRLRIRKEPIKYYKVNKGRINCLKIDYEKFNSLKKEGKKKLVFHLNEHSEGCEFKFYWERPKFVFMNKAPYKFYAVRKNNRLLAHKIKKEGKDYFF